MVHFAALAKLALGGLCRQGKAPASLRPCHLAPVSLPHYVPVTLSLCPYLTTSLSPCPCVPASLESLRPCHLVPASLESLRPCHLAPVSLPHNVPVILSLCPCLTKKLRPLKSEVLKALTFYFPVIALRVSFLFKDTHVII